jgi:hypothetical protein
MRGLDAAIFDSTDLVLQSDEADSRVWRTSAGDMVTLCVLPASPNYRAIPADLDRIRAKTREQATQYRGAIIEAELCTVDGVGAVRDIIKVPQAPTGMGYLGSLALPLRDCAYIVMVACPERGITGTRDTAILAKLMQSGDVKFEPGKEQPIGWMQDPYDPSIKGPPARNRSEDEAFDVLFPEHPLSRARALLRRIERTLRLSDEVKGV